MKKGIITAAILSVLLIGCKDNKTSNTETSGEIEMTHDHNTAHVLNNSWVDEIQLDNGNLWEANSETNEGVEKMLDLTKSRNLQTVEDYHGLSKDLNEVKNYVVRECTMKGPSHDNLHVFLHPLIDKIDALGKVSSAKEGQRTTEAIQENLELYQKYFK